MLKKKRWSDFVVVRFYRFILFVITLQWVTKVKFMEQYMSNDNKKNIRLNFLKGSQSHNPSQTNVDAKVQINIDTAIPKLEKLAKKYVGMAFKNTSPELWAVTKCQQPKNLIQKTPLLRKVRSDSCRNCALRYVSCRCCNVFYIFLSAVWVSR